MSWAARRISVCAFALCLGCGGHPASPRAEAPPSAPSPLLGQPIEFHLPASTGALVAVPLRGVNATVLDFWAPTCKPCRKSVPELVARETELAERGARLVLVAVLADGESTDHAREVLASWGVERPFLVDREDVSRRSAGVTSLPSTLVLDDQGKLRWSAPAGATASDVTAAIP